MTTVSRKKKTLSIVSTLVVLCGVVLCLGAIATPKFVTFSCKSKQSEAKTNLIGLFTAQKAFFGEYGFYTTDLVSLPWTPDGSPLYAYGFASPSEKTSNPKLPELDPTRRTSLDPRLGTGYSLAKTKALSGRALADEDFQSLTPSATASSAGFLIAAIGDIDTDGQEDQLDVWTINERKDLTVVANDCTE